MYTINPALIGVSETWLNKTIKNGQIVAKEDFEFYRKDREGKKRGGFCY